MLCESRFGAEGRAGVNRWRWQVSIAVCLLLCAISLVAASQTQRRATEVFTLREALLIHGRIDSHGQYLLRRIAVAEERLRREQSRAQIIDGLSQMLLLQGDLRPQQMEVSEQLVTRFAPRNRPLLRYVVRFAARKKAAGRIATEISGTADLLWNYADLRTTIRNIQVDLRDAPSAALSVSLSAR